MVRVVSSILLYILSSNILFTSCGEAAAADAGSSADSLAPSEQFDSSATTIQDDKKVTLYATVDRLALRTVPDTKAESIGYLSYGATVIDLGEETDFKDKITLGGRPHYAAWRKVTFQSSDKNELVGWVYGGGLSKSKPAPVVVSPPKPASTSVADLRAKLKARELAAPKKHLTVTKAVIDANRVSRGFLKGKRTDGYWLSGSIWCSSSTAYYQDVVLQVIGMSKTGTRVGSERYILYDVFAPGYSTKYRLKIDGMKGASHYDVTVFSAKPYVGEGMEHMGGD